MTNTKTKSHRIPVYRRPLFVIFILLTIIACVVIVFFLIHKNPVLESDSEPTSIPDSSVTNPETPNDHQGTESPEEPERPTQFEGEDPNELDTLTGRIAYRGVDASQNILAITASIDQYLSSGGSCHLSLYRANAEVYSADLAASPDVTTSVCGPFEVPLDRLSSGAYNITIKVTSDDKTGAITGEIEI